MKSYILKSEFEQTIKISLFRIARRSQFGDGSHERSQIYAVKDVVLKYVPYAGLMALGSSEYHGLAYYGQPHADRKLIRAECLAEYGVCFVVTVDIKSTKMISVHIIEDSNDSASRVFYEVVLEKDSEFVDAYVIEENKLMIVSSRSGLYRKNSINDLYFIKIDLQGPKITILAKKIDNIADPFRIALAQAKSSIKLFTSNGTSQPRHLDLRFDYFDGVEHISHFKLQLSCLLEGSNYRVTNSYSYSLDCINPVKGHIFGISLTEDNIGGIMLTRPTQQHSQYRWPNQDCVKVHRIAKDLYMCLRDRIAYAIYLKDEMVGQLDLKLQNQIDILQRYIIEIDLILPVLVDMYTVVIVIAAVKAPDENVKASYGEILMFCIDIRNGQIQSTRLGRYDANLASWKSESQRIQVNWIENE